MQTMKKILLLMMTTLAITGCSNEEQDNLVPEEVTVNIDYDFGKVEACQDPEQIYTLTSIINM